MADASGWAEVGAAVGAALGGLVVAVRGAPALVSKIAAWLAAAAPPPGEDRRDGIERRYADWHDHETTKREVARMALEQRAQGQKLDGIAENVAFIRGRMEAE